jgi:hypothetical protein
MIVLPDWIRLVKNTVDQEQKDIFDMLDSFDTVVYKLLVLQKNEVNENVTSARYSFC